MTFFRSGICLLLAAALVSSADTPSTLASVPHAKQLYYQGIYGDKNASAQADKVFTALHKANPSDPLVSVYYGSLRLLEAAHTWALWRKNSLSKEGIRLMDAAVERAPENLEIRFVRAATELNLPAFFGRHQQAQQ